MTKKHFIAVAADIRRVKDTGDAETARRIAEFLCDTFKRLNPAFDRSRFMVACGF